MRTDFESIASRFDRIRVLVMGDAILDEYVSGACSRLSPEAPVPVVHVRGRRGVLGGAGNTAANIASLGGRPELLALIGDDAGGQELAAAAAAAEIDFIAVPDGRPTLRKVRIIGDTQQLVRLDYEDLSAPSPESQERLVRLLSERMPSCDIVVVSDYAKGTVSAEVCRQAISEAHRLGKEVVIDPRPEHRDFYRHGDYVTPNWREAQGLLRRLEEPQTEAGIRHVGRSLSAELDTSVLLTLGVSGIAFFGRGGTEEMTRPTVAREVFDVSGAGDTVVATFALARASGATNALAIELANAAAGIVVGKFGTATVSREELLNRDSEPTVVSRAELSALAARLRNAGKRIATINGSFDLLHSGHLHILRQAADQGDVLIVGLNSDSSVRSHKGPGRPAIPQEQRAEMLLALRFVDYVHIFTEADPIAFIEEVRPDVHVNGSECGAQCLEAPVVSRYGGRIHLVDRIPGGATTELLGNRRSKNQL